jgi:gliding motility-associated-like protein
LRSRLLHIILTAFIALPVLSQVELSRQVIGSSGQSFQNNEIMISSTVGETVIENTETSPLLLTQGFQQSSEKTVANINYTVSTKEETCPDTEDGEIVISDLEGCDGGNYDIEWENGESGPQISNLSAGWYAFEIIACGRVISDSARVGRIYESSCLLKFYTAFSPNSDGVNDTWIIDNITSEPNSQNEVNIFNQWGNLVYTFVNYNNTNVAWDGKDEKGKEVTEGTYYYVVNIKNDSYSGYTEVTR